MSASTIVAAIVSATRWWASATIFISAAISVSHPVRFDVRVMSLWWPRVGSYCRYVLNCATARLQLYLHFPDWDLAGGVWRTQPRLVVISLPCFSFPC
jgi:hypothetical protein